MRRPMTMGLSEYVQEELAAKDARIQRLVGLLKEVEWVVTHNGGMCWFCEKMVGEDEEGHAPDCELYKEISLDRE